MRAIYDYVSNVWETSIIPQLMQYISIPNKSPAYDPNWKANGFMDQAMQLLIGWCQQQPIAGMQINLIAEENRTPLLFIEIPGEIEETIVLYGHMDKQPEMTGWHPDLGPWKPVLEDDKLYGRGGADDGYAVFSALTAIAALQQQKIAHGRCVILIEACEESGSFDLPFYLDRLKKQIGKPNLVICLDSEAGNYQQIWLTTSLRGLVGGKLTIAVTQEGIHSGLGSGIVPSPFMILRQLLARIENMQTGKILLKEFHVKIPKHCIEQAQQTARIYGKTFYTAYPFLPGVKPIHNKLAELLLNRTWRPQLSVTGFEGLPSPANAGNVTVPQISVQLSLRLPPSCDAKKAAAALEKVVKQNAPFGARITFKADHFAPGCEIPKSQPWLEKAAQTASKAFFNKSAVYFGTGGTIPFIRMLRERYPQSQFIITGVLGPKSNAHGPNEFLHIPMAKKITACVAAIIAAHYEHHQTK